jgi:hypothetical protein
MPKVQRLQPHDPLPDAGRYMLVLRRFGEDDPQVAVTEIIMADGKDPPELTVAVRPDGTPMAFQEAIGVAEKRAEREGCPAVFVVDRTAGPREREVLRHHGDHAVHTEKLADEATGEEGSDIRDRPTDAGYNLTPHSRQ